MAQTDFKPALFTDQQVIAATGLPVDSLRRLITWGAVQPSQSGGGRGRVRLWTTGQALRICVTSEFVAAGFSLQMAHTLAYCLPLGNTMLFFDPSYLARLAQSSSSVLKPLLRLLTQKRQPRLSGRRGEFANSHVLILEHRFVYSGGAEHDFELVAEIDSKRQRVIPFHDPVREVDGDREEEDGPTIDTTSLLVDRRFLTAPATPDPRKAKQEIQARKLDLFMCKSLLSVDLTLSFVLCVRRLQGLETRFTPGYADEADE